MMSDYIAEFLSQFAEGIEADKMFSVLDLNVNRLCYSYSSLAQTASDEMFGEARSRILAFLFILINTFNERQKWIDYRNRYSSELLDEIARDGFCMKLLKEHRDRLCEETLKAYGKLAQKVSTYMHRTLFQSFCGCLFRILDMELRNAGREDICQRFEETYHHDWWKGPFI